MAAMRHGYQGTRPEYLFSLMDKYNRRWFEPANKAKGSTASYAATYIVSPTGEQQNNDSEDKVGQTNANCEKVTTGDLVVVKKEPGDTDSLESTGATETRTAEEGNKDEPENPTDTDAADTEKHRRADLYRLHAQIRIMLKDGKAIDAIVEQGVEKYGPAPMKGILSGGALPRSVQLAKAREYVHTKSLEVLRQGVLKEEGSGGGGVGAAEDDAIAQRDETPRLRDDLSKSPSLERILRESTQAEEEMEEGKPTRSGSQGARSRNNDYAHGDRGKRMAGAGRSRRRSGSISPRFEKRNRRYRSRSRDRAGSTGHSKSLVRRSPRRLSSGHGGARRYPRSRSPRRRQSDDLFRREVSPRRERSRFSRQNRRSGSRLHEDAHRSFNRSSRQRSPTQQSLGSRHHSGSAHSPIISALDFAGGDSNIAPSEASSLAGTRLENAMDSSSRDRRSGEKKVDSCDVRQNASRRSSTRSSVRLNRPESDSPLEEHRPGRLLLDRGREVDRSRRSVPLTPSRSRDRSPRRKPDPPPESCWEYPDKSRSRGDGRQQHSRSPHRGVLSPGHAIASALGLNDSGPMTDHPHDDIRSQCRSGLWEADCGRSVPDYNSSMVPRENRRLRIEDALARLSRSRSPSEFLPPPQVVARLSPPRIIPEFSHWKRSDADKRWPSGGHGIYPRSRSPEHGMPGRGTNRSRSPWRLNTEFSYSYDRSLTSAERPAEAFYPTSQCRNRNVLPSRRLSDQHSTEALHADSSRCDRGRPQDRYDDQRVAHTGNSRQQGRLFGSSSFGVNSEEQKHGLGYGGQSTNSWDDSRRGRGGYSSSRGATGENSMDSGRGAGVEGGSRESTRAGRSANYIMRFANFVTGELIDEAPPPKEDPEVKRVSIPPSVHPGPRRQFANFVDEVAPPKPAVNYGGTKLQSDNKLPGGSGALSPGQGGTVSTSLPLSASDSTPSDLKNVEIQQILKAKIPSMDSLEQVESFKAQLERVMREVQATEEKLASTSKGAAPIPQLNNEGQNRIAKQISDKTDSRDRDYRVRQQPLTNDTDVKIKVEDCSASSTTDTGASGAVTPGPQQIYGRIPQRDSPSGSRYMSRPPFRGRGGGAGRYHSFGAGRSQYGSRGTSHRGGNNYFRGNNSGYGGPNRSQGRPEEIHEQVHRNDTFRPSSNDSHSSSLSDAGQNGPLSGHPNSNRSNDNIWNSNNSNNINKNNNNFGNQSINNGRGGSTVFQRHQHFGESSSLHGSVVGSSLRRPVGAGNVGSVLQGQWNRGGHSFGNSADSYSAGVMGSAPPQAPYYRRLDPIVSPSSGMDATVTPKQQPDSTSSGSSSAIPQPSQVLISMPPPHLGPAFATRFSAEDKADYYYRRPALPSEGDSLTPFRGPVEMAPDPRGIQPRPGQCQFYRPDLVAPSSPSAKPPPSPMPTLFNHPDFDVPGRYDRNAARGSATAGSSKPTALYRTDIPPRLVSINDDITNAPLGPKIASCGPPLQRSSREEDDSVQFKEGSLTDLQPRSRADGMGFISDSRRAFQSAQPDGVAAQGTYPPFEATGAVPLRIPAEQNRQEDPTVALMKARGFNF